MPPSKSHAQPFMLKIFTLTLLAGGLLLGTASPGECRSIAKQSIADAVKTNFFQWFHFTEKERKKEPGEKTAVSFTTGMGGHTVQLVVTLDQQDRITDMILALPEGFVHDAKYKPFACDIAKSFIQTAVPDADAPQVQDLVNDISFRGATWTGFQHLEAKTTYGKNKDKPVEIQHDVSFLKEGSGPIKKGDTAWVGFSSVPKLKDKPTSGFLAYVGESQKFEEKLADDSLLRIESKEMGGKKYVVLIVNTH